MIKAVLVFKRRPGMSRKEFKEYWLNKHAILEKENVENKWVRKIVASFAIEDESLPEPPWDGMVELYFDSMEDMKRDVEGEQRQIMQADEENFMDHSFPEMLCVTQEYLVAVKTPRECQI
jgi:uncharacterized protein (TIGR02118 family)